MSCHYVVDVDGRITQMVGEEMRAWHAGASIWKGETDTNSRSIGIEIHNPGDRDYPQMQIAAVIDLCRDILARHAIPPAHVLAHSDVAPMRKADPGERFDWARLHCAGIGHWVQPSTEQGGGLTPGDAGPAVRELQLALAAYGYGIAASASYDAETATVVKAFQRHFRPLRVDGIADRGTLDTLARLAAALPGSA